MVLALRGQIWNGTHYEEGEGMPPLRRGQNPLIDQLIR